MKSSITVLLILVSIVTVTAQTSNLVLFSDDGQSFTAYVNGEQVNASPQTNVKKTDITGEGVKVRIVFTNAIPELSKYVMLTPNEELTLSVAKNKKGQYTFKMVSAAPISSSSASVSYTAPSPAPQATVTASNDVEQVNTTTTTVQSTTVNNQVNMSAPGISITSTVGTPNQVNANVNINLNATIHDPTLNSASTTTTTTTSSTTSSSTSLKEKPVATTSSKSSGKDWESCALENSDYESAMNSIRSKSFSDAKMTVAKQVLKNNCVTTSQVKGMAQLFQYEEDKLAFVKYAYDYTSDKKNFYKVNDVFTFETTISELNKYLETRQ